MRGQQGHSRHPVLSLCSTDQSMPVNLVTARIGQFSNMKVCPILWQ